MKTITKYVILATVVILIVYDFIAIGKSGKESSISWVVIEMSYDYPMITFLVGFTCGHLFWRMKKPSSTQQIDLIVKK